MSKPSAAEHQYMDMLAMRMQARELVCCVFDDEIAVERSHPRGPLWETGTGLKAHDWFVIPLSKKAHDLYHADIPAFEAKYGSHAKLLKTFWRRLGINPGDWMTVGMSPKRESWFNRVLDRVMADGMSEYERAIFGESSSKTTKGINS